MVAPSGGSHGGIEIFTAAIAREVLDEGKIDVRLVYRVAKGLIVQNSLEKSISKLGVNIRYITNIDWQYIKDLFWADIIHCHFPLIYATYPARLLGKKLIVTVENQRVETHGSRFVIGLRLAHIVWFISKFVAQTWGKKDFDINCAIVPAVSDLPTAYVPPEKRNGLFFIARWVPLKGLEQLVEAYATAQIDRVSNPLFLYGDGVLREKIETLVDHLSIREFVKMPGFVSPEEKERQMASSRWNIAPVAFQEDLGLTPIEARCCGVPSIVSRAGGVPEAAGEQALFCEPGDVASLRLALEQAVHMQENEYVKRSELCKQSLNDYLRYPGFYTEEYLRILGHV